MQFIRESTRQTIEFKEDLADIADEAVMHATDRHQ